MVNTIAKKGKLNYQNLIGLVEKKHLKVFDKNEAGQTTINPGDVIRIGYKIMEGEKERIQYYEGLVISMQNRALSKTFKIRRTVQGVGVEQTFFENSPKIISLTKKQSSKIRRAKLYFLRDLKGKATRLKEKR